MSELKQAAEKALVVLGSATSFMSRKARDQHESVVAELRTAIQQAETQQPVTAEPVLYIHPDTFAMNNAHVGAWKPGHELTGYLPLYTHPAPGVPDDVVRDADRLNWLARNPVDAIDVFGKSRPDEARFIRATIDAAMLTAAQAQKGQQ